MSAAKLRGDAGSALSSYSQTLTCRVAPPGATELLHPTARPNNWINITTGRARQQQRARNRPTQARLLCSSHRAASVGNTFSIAHSQLRSASASPYIATLDRILRIWLSISGVPGRSIRCIKYKGTLSIHDDLYSARLRVTSYWLHPKPFAPPLLGGPRLQAATRSCHSLLLENIFVHNRGRTAKRRSSPRFLVFRKQATGSGWQPASTAR